MIRLTAVALMIVATISSCKKPTDEIVEAEDYKGVYVINEGAFGKGNGSIGLYKTGNITYQDDVTKKQTGLPLGETVQSVTKINDKYFVAVTGSSKVDIFGSDWKFISSLSFPSPRYILSVSPTKAYVTNVFYNNISIIDPTTNTISASQIAVPSGTDKMVMDSSKAFILSGYGKKFVYVVTTADDKLIDSIDVGLNPAGIVVAGGKIYVLNTGDATNSIKGRISVIGINSRKVERFYELDASYYGGDLKYYGGNLYASLGNDKLYLIQLNATSMSTSFITAPGSIYGFNINTNGDIYIADAGDYVNQGKVHIYSSAGVFQKTFTAGFVPNGFFFNE
ncbi:MAG: hypothetical protein H7321_09730 [Bacteroidia bacterium]|nr:hypothetical protein [Bacteroidia bacterium]